MKTKLLYITGLLFVFFTSCSVDENNEVLEQEKELKVNSLIKSFAEDVIPSKDYINFVNDVRIKSSTGLSQSELNQLEEDFLNKQTDEFIELYYFVASLDLTEDELMELIFDYFSSANKSFSADTKNDTEECAIIETDEEESFLLIFLRLICEVSRTTIN
ncbi:hypothetical protein [Aquimarina sp. SS2-1]|uniref:hypothetical protein n=1 Tax=Aquimarina besae TaxID=3342247 RepID=UPI00366F542E